LVTTIHNILTELYSAATDERDKGDRLEGLMAAYRRTDVTWSVRFSNVWLWSDWPDRQGKPDTGIELVAEERATGGLTAIQCKFYAPTHYLQTGDIDSFFTASGKAGFTARVIVSTADKRSKLAEDELVHGRPDADRFRVRGFIEEGTTTTPFDMLVRNKASRCHLVMDALNNARRTHRAPPTSRPSPRPGWPSTTRTSWSTSRTCPSSATGCSATGPSRAKVPFSADGS
jgi:hypothetical protein